MCARRERSCTHTGLSKSNRQSRPLNSPLGLLIIDGGLWVIGIVLYLRATHTRRFAGHLVLWTFIVVFAALWLFSFNGAPPPSVHVLVTVDLILFPIVLGWSYWIDRVRQPNKTSAHV